MRHGTPGSLIKHILITGIETQAGFVAEWQLDRRHLFNSALLKIAVFEKTNVLCMCIFLIMRLWSSSAGVYWMYLPDFCLCVGENDDRDLEKLEEKVWDPSSSLTEKQIDQFLVVAR